MHSDEIKKVKNSPKMQKKMLGMKLPGNSDVSAGLYDVPTAGFGQVLLKMKVASLCGSDLKFIYFEHTDKTGGARYDNVIAGHEPSGQVVAVGEGVKNLKVGDRVAVYHIQGCGYCDECSKGYFINCQQPERRAYGWQRDGALAEYMVADESTCIQLTDFLTYEDGAMIACGFGTAYQGLLRANVSGRDTVLVMGLGPVGQAVIMLAKAMGAITIGVDISEERIEMAKNIGADYVLHGGGSNGISNGSAGDNDGTSGIGGGNTGGNDGSSGIGDGNTGDNGGSSGIGGGNTGDNGANESVVDQILSLTGGKGVEVAIDCSGSQIGRHRCLEAARMWGNVVFLGEQGSFEFEPSPLLLHKNLTLHGSWVTSVDNMAKLVELLDRKKIHPSRIITHRFPLEETALAFKTFATGKTGKVAIVME